MRDLLLSPSLWQTRLAALGLAAGAGLPALLKQRQLPEARRLLWRAWLIEPLLTGLLIAGLLGASGLEWKYLRLGLVYGLIWHWSCLLWLGLFASLASARLAGMVGGLVMGLSLGGLRIGFLWLLALLYGALGMSAVGWAEEGSPTMRHRMLGFAKRCSAQPTILSFLASALVLWAGYQAGIWLSPGDAFAGSLIGVCLALGLNLGALCRSWRLALLGGAGLPLAGGLFLASSHLLATPDSPLSWLLFALNDAALSSLLASLLSGLASLPGLWADEFARFLRTPANARPSSDRPQLSPALLLLGSVYALLAYYQNAPIWMTGLGLAAWLLGAAYPWWLPVLLYPLEELWNHALYFWDQRHPTEPPGGRFTWHSVWWHERQYLYRPSLFRYLVWLRQCGRMPALDAWATHNETAAVTYRQAALECDTRLLESVHEAGQISACHATLSGKYAAHDAHASLLRRFQTFSRDVAVAFAQSDSYRQRLLLLDVEERLNHLSLELHQQARGLARRFQAIAADWRKAVLREIKLLEELSRSRQEIPNPYIVGIPLTTKESVFIERSRILARIEKLIREAHCPPILLYGQRRTGKTSLLHNLHRLMSSRLLFVYLDMQSPRFMTADLGLFLGGIVASAQRVLPELPGLPGQGDPLLNFDAWLDQLEATLAGRTLLVAIDEFATLEEARQRGQLPENVLFTLLNTLRHIIQHRRHVRVILAGSNTLDELQGWAGYLINAQVVHLGYLTEEEARQLIERPVPDFSLRYTPQALARILKLTCGHPALVQLLCSELVEYKNSQPQITRLAELEEVEAALDEALSSGSMLFSDLAHNQLSPEALALALELARQGEDARLPASAVGETRNAALRQLLKREVWEAREDAYVFQVEMFRRGVLAVGGG